VSSLSEKDEDQQGDFPLSVTLARIPVSPHTGHDGESLSTFVPASDDPLKFLLVASLVSDLVFQNHLQSSLSRGIGTTDPSLGVSHCEPENRCQEQTGLSEDSLTLRDEGASGIDSGHVPQWLMINED
jgi:hypothetical protein